MINNTNDHLLAPIDRLLHHNDAIVAVKGQDPDVHQVLGRVDLKLLQRFLGVAVDIVFDLLLRGVFKLIRCAFKKLSRLAVDVRGVVRKELQLLVEFSFCLRIIASFPQQRPNKQSNKP
ncbi:MAG: hypothetical protein KDA20_06675 [Phycisphaerales bacterium]|nr:hypothetical protein [Phycisphaerales bacterium]